MHTSGPTMKTSNLSPPFFFALPLVFLACTLNMNFTIEDVSLSAAVYNVMKYYYIKIKFKVKTKM